jgi:SmpA/OmlA family protein
MAMNIRLLTPLLLAAALAGCVNYGSIAPGTTADQLSARAGRPAEVWKNADGTETWEYRYAPSGWYTYMVDLGPDHAVRAVHQVLAEEYFAKVTPGMSRDQVRRLLGEPKDVARYAGQHEEVWSWRFKESNNWYRLFNVHFDQASGAVLRVSRMDDPYMYDKGGKGKGG